MGVAFWVMGTSCPPQYFSIWGQPSEPPVSLLNIYPLSIIKCSLFEPEECCDSTFNVLLMHGAIRHAISEAAWWKLDAYSQTHSCSVEQVKIIRVSNETFITVVQNFLKNIWGFVFYDCTWFWTNVREKKLVISGPFNLTFLWKAGDFSGDLLLVLPPTQEIMTWANLGDKLQAGHEYTNIQ